MCEPDKLRGFSDSLPLRSSTVIDKEPLHLILGVHTGCCRKDMK
ncbi:MAG: hypothetical protein QXH66_07400 [Conexivisphaerales archaeon]